LYRTWIARRESPVLGRAVDAAEWHGQVQVQQGQQVVAGFLNEVAAATDPLTFAQARSPPMCTKACCRSHRMGYHA
jgi:hypothetical protein